MFNKYLKYKKKYLDLINKQMQEGGSDTGDHIYKAVDKREIINAFFKEKNKQKSDKTKYYKIKIINGNAVFDEIGYVDDIWNSITHNKLTDKNTPDDKDKLEYKEEMLDDKDTVENISIYFKKETNDKSPDKSPILKLTKYDGLLNDWVIYEIDKTKHTDDERVAAKKNNQEILDKETHRLMLIINSLSSNK